MIARRLQLAPYLTFLFPPKRRYRAFAHRAAARPLRPDVVNARAVDATRQANESNGRIGNDHRHRSPSALCARGLCEASDYVAVRVGVPQQDAGDLQLEPQGLDVGQGADVAIQRASCWVTDPRGDGDFRCLGDGIVWKAFRPFVVWRHGRGSRTRVATRGQPGDHAQRIRPTPDMAFLPLPSSPSPGPVRPQIKKKEFLRAARQGLILRRASRALVSGRLTKVRRGAERPRRNNDSHRKSRQPTAAALLRETGGTWENGATPDHAGTSLSFVPGPSRDADRVHPSNLTTDRCVGPV